MKKRWLLLLGVCLIAVSCVLLAVYLLGMQAGAAESERIAAKMDALLPERAPAGIHSEAEMPALEIDGKDYVALLEVFDRRLPIADRWDSGRPSRFSGSAYDSTLVIGGPDHPRQFGFCGEIDLGVPITLTDMTGGQLRYTVARVDRSKTADARWLQDPDFDLTIFCHDTLSATYIAVRCQLR